MKTQFIKNITLLLAICVPALLFAQEPSEPKPAAEVVKATFENSMFINNQTVQTHDKGFLDEEDIQFICMNNKHVFIDTKKILDNHPSKYCHKIIADSIIKNIK